jgi:LAO/AO transport system kinase
VNRAAAPEGTARSVLAGDRRALARAITLVESTREDHRQAADLLLERVLPRTGRSVRIGISGAPGVGKSTFIETFGRHVISRGHKLAVLAVDPSSQRSGGSILGDKTRMEELGRSPDAFIRPSPTGGTLGGVARRTREAVLLCEAAGFDVVIVETVGVGQSETAVADLVDMFVLLLLPSGGDELQGLKKGIVELADLLVISKADGDLAKAAGRSAAEYSNALHVLRPVSVYWTPEVLTCSALENRGVAEVWDRVTDYVATMRAAGAFTARRERQARRWMWSAVDEALHAAFRANPRVQALLSALEDEVASGRTTPTRAARKLLDAFAGAA